MNNLYKEIVIDGGMISHSFGRFRGLGAVLDGKSSRILEESLKIKSRIRK